MLAILTSTSFYLTITLLGEDWYASMRTKTGSSSLHILDPTGFEIQLMKSIVDDDAYLPRCICMYFP